MSCEEDETAGNGVETPRPSTAMRADGVDETAANAAAEPSGDDEAAGDGIEAPRPFAIHSGDDEEAAGDGIEAPRPFAMSC